MGDRTTVTLTVLTSQIDTAKTFFAHDCCDTFSDGHITNFTFEEVNYGDLDFLAALSNAGIAYNSYWCAGSDFDAGTTYARFTPKGDLKNWDIYDNAINPDINELLKYVSKPDQLVRYVLAHVEVNTVPNLDENQIEYGKLYQTMQLITVD